MPTKTTTNFSVSNRIARYIARVATLTFFACVAVPQDADAQKLPVIPTPPTVVAPEPPTRPFTPIEKAYQRAIQEELKRREAEQRKQQEVKTLESELEKLLEEFGPNARYFCTNYFIYIYDVSDAYAKWCSALVENAANAYVTFARRLKLPIQPIEEPMIVVIFSRKEDYEAYARKVAGSEFDAAKNKPIGFYSTSSNRSVFYDMTGVEKSKTIDEKSNVTRKTTLEEVAAEILKRDPAEENLSVIVHETARQISYNLGLFARDGENPKWAIEGLAMLFEPPCGPTKFGGWKPDKDFPINKRRILEFKAYEQNSADARPVRRCVELERILDDEPCAYPLSWAIFYYLYKHYPKELAYYLYYCRMQEPRMAYSDTARVMEFEYFFGDDWDGMYLQLKVYVESLLLQANGLSEEEADKLARKKYNVPEEEPKQKGKDAKQKRTPKKTDAANTNDSAKRDAAKETKPDGAEALKETEKPEANQKQETKSSATATKSKPDVKKSETKTDKQVDAEDDDWLNSWNKEE